MQSCLNQLFTRHGVAVNLVGGQFADRCTTMATRRISIIFIGVCVLLTGISLVEPCAAVGDDKSAVTQLVLRMETVEKKPPDAKSVQTAIRLIKTRLKRAKIDGASVRARGMHAIEVRVSATNDTEIKRIAKLVSRPGTLEFALLANARDHGAIIAAARGVVGDVHSKTGQLIASWRDVERDSKGKPVGIGKQGGVESRPSPHDKSVAQYLVICERKDRRVDQSGILSLSSSTDDDGRPVVGFRLKESASLNMQRLTGNNLPTDDGFRRRLAVLIDGRVHLAPNIEGRISDGGIISRFSKQDVTDFIAAMSSGEPLPLKITGVTIKKPE